MRACFRDGLDITQPAVLASLANTAGMDGPRLLKQVQEPAIKEALRSNNDEAVAAGVIGVPSLVVNGEVFWGDDRLAEAATAATRDKRDTGNGRNAIA